VPRAKVRRLPLRGSNERAVVDSILDEALVCHVGFSTLEGPVVLPTLFVRAGDVIALHGAVANAMLGTLARGEQACCTVTLIDALVMARSAFHHSVNYRSAVVFGTCRAVEDPKEKLALFEALVEKVVPGRYAAVRSPTDSELRATRVVAMRIEEASAKIRTGPPIDEEEDYLLPIWAGELPFVAGAGAPVPDPRLVDGTVPPRFVDGRWSEG
jgi:uncharacterized protein